MNGLVITGVLEALTALHLGKGSGTDLTDAPLRRDGSGTFFIPGTAIAGALRALLTRTGPRLGAAVCHAMIGDDRPCNCSVCELMGDIHPLNTDDSPSRASRLLVFSAFAEDRNPAPSIRDGVGIDRSTATSARAGRTKFDREVMPAGSRFSFRIELRDEDSASNDLRRLLAAAILEWGAGRAWLGGGTARGLGRFVLKDIHIFETAIQDVSQLMAFLKSDRPWEACAQTDVETWLAKHRLRAEDFVSMARLQEELKDESAGASGSNSGARSIARRVALDAIVRNWIEFSASMVAQGPFVSHDATTAGATGFDHAPLLELDGNWQTPVLSGASLRGVLRFQAEKIARTLASFEAYQKGGEAAFLECCPACNPVEGRPKSPLASCAALVKDKDRFHMEDRLQFLKDGLASEHLCLGCRLFGSTWEGSRLFVSDAPFEPNNGKKPPTYKMMDFLALDRFTGGGLEGAKFDALSLWEPRFRVHIRLENPKAWELGWLALALRDLATGWVPVGLGAAKGFGRVKMEQIRVRHGYLGPEDNLDPYRLLKERDDGMFRFLEAEPENWAMLKPIVTAWVEDFLNKLLCFKRNPKTRLQSDTYFRGDIPQHYPLEVKLP